MSEKRYMEGYTLGSRIGFGPELDLRLVKILAPEPECLHHGEFKCEDCGKSISVEYVKGSELEVTELLEEIKDLFVTGREYGHNEGLV